MWLLSAVVLLAVLGITAGATPSCYDGATGSPPLCSNCRGTCSAISGCKCSNSTTCIPIAGTCSLNSTSCCPPNFSWYQTLTCCTVEPVCSPACLADEACQYVNKTAVCVTNATYYQGQGVANVSKILTCKGANMTISVGSNLMELLGYNPSGSSLSQANCTGAQKSILQGKRVYSLTVTSLEGACGNKMTKNATHVSYTNVLFIPGQFSSGAYLAGNISLQFSCTYNMSMQTSLFTVYKPVMNTQNLTSGGTGGDGTTTLAAYENPSFTSPLQQSQQQNLAAGSTLYFGLTTQFTDSAYVLRVEQCFATPTADGSGSVKIQLIKGGCTTGAVPGVQVIDNGVSKEVRFSVLSFSFQGYDSVYLFCDARLCNSASEKCSACTTARAVNDGTSRFTLGPFTVTGYIDSSAICNKGWSFTLFAGSLLALWTLL